MNKLGIQCQEKHEEVYRYNCELLPVVVKSINILDREHYTKLATENPGVQLVYRQVPNGPWDNEGDGRRWAEHLYNLVSHIPEITMIEGHNEWIHSPPHNAPEDFERADRFMVEFIDRVHELWEGRVHAVVLNASCGHFNEDIIDFFPRTLAKLQECGKCLLDLHEYDHPESDMKGDGGHNLCGKFLRNLAGLRAAGYDKVRIAIGECGVDSGVGSPAGSGHVGFKYWGEGAATRYLNERNLGWYLPLVQETEGIAWATIFGCGMGGDWGSFDIKNTAVIDGIGQIFSGWTPPKPPNGGDMDIEIRDFDGNLQNWDWLTQTFGDVQVHPVEDKFGIQSGDHIYKVAYLWAKRGYASCMINVKDVNGDNVKGDTVMWGWSGAPPHSYSDKGWNWTENGVPGDTNETGDVGPGMGIGAYYDPSAGERGPHWCWVWDKPSDYVDGLGMLALTNHDHVDVGYQEVVWNGDEPEPPEPPVDGDLLDEVKEIRLLVAEIRNILIEEPPDEPPDPEPPPPEEVFTVHFFNNTTLSGPPVHTMTEPLFEGKPFFWHTWGTGSPAPGVNVDNFSGRWEGIFPFVETRIYRFNVLTDDGVRLWVDGELVIDQWHDQAPHLYSADVALTAGEHGVKIEWYERGGGATLHFSWE